MTPYEARGAVVVSPYATRLNGVVRCDVCPRACRLHEGQRGLCYVRERRGDDVVLTTYGRSTGFCIDPIEKKPLNHFLPGSPVLSFGTAGCNLTCRFCQNWEMSTARGIDLAADTAGPGEIADAAVRHGCRSVAFTYNDPTPFVEYAIDTADACHDRGVRTVAVTNGYISPGPRRDLYARIDAANVDLKAFTPEFYRRLCTARLDAVLDTLRYLVHETATWVEITTLLIPGCNDGDDELDALTRWVADELGAQVPLHFTAFHPEFRMRDVPPTPPATLTRARRIGRDNGLAHVYTGNVRDPEGGTTDCPGCGTAVIGRDGYRITRWELSDDGRCGVCDRPLAGVFAGPPGTWGARRRPVRLGAR